MDEPRRIKAVLLGAWEIIHTEVVSEAFSVAGYERIQVDVTVLTDPGSRINLGIETSPNKQFWTPARQRMTLTPIEVENDGRRRSMSRLEIPLDEDLERWIRLRLVPGPGIPKSVEAIAFLQPRKLRHD